MKKPSLLMLTRLAMAALVAMLVTSCASNNTPQKRIERNPQQFMSLSPKDRELVTNGAIREGMNKEAVFLAWGLPSQTSVGRSGGREIEQWTYQSQRPVRVMTTGFGMGMGYGYGMGGYGPWGYGYPGYGWGPTFGMGSDIVYVPYTSGVVSFRNGRVSEWKAALR